MVLPDQLQGIVSRIQALIADPRHFEKWQSRIREWTVSEEVQPSYEEVEFSIATSGKPKKVKATYASDDFHKLVPMNPSLPYEFALLAAVNDVAACDDSTVVVLNPFPTGPTEAGPDASTPDKDAVIRGALFCALKSRVDEISSKEVPRLDFFLDAVRADLGDKVVPPGSGNRRGRKKADYNTQARESDLARKWKSAKESGTYKAEFAKENNLSVKEFDRLLGRVAKRNRRQDK
ncbi:MAG: hypothetical protein KDA57_19395 [Planctomycetales bacterium]|nr:hypothetical protein [Planctomycetales bacterium]